MKLYLYPHNRIHTQDTISEYWNTTPFSIEGIKKYCTIIESPGEADFFYMGQIIDMPSEPFKENSYPYLQEFPTKHILDLEGDWKHPNTAPEWVIKCIKSLNSSKHVHCVEPYIVRPCMSKLLVFLGKNNPVCDIEYPIETSFGFRGQMDPFRTRLRMFQCINKIGAKSEIIFNSRWGGTATLESEIVSDYIKVLNKNILSLCPEGDGSSTIRVYETCFFGRVPVILGDTEIMEEHNYDTSFAFKIPITITDEELCKELIRVYETPHSELVERGKKSRQYFQDVLVKYFQDPTQYFINFMKTRNIL